MRRASSSITSWSWRETASTTGATSSSSSSREPESRDTGARSGLALPQKGQLPQKSGGCLKSPSQPPIHADRVRQRRGTKGSSSASSENGSVAFVPRETWAELSPGRDRPLDARRLVPMRFAGAARRGHDGSTRASRQGMANSLETRPSVSLRRFRALRWRWRWSRCPTSLVPMKWSISSNNSV
jgi:hypothetical protein